MATENTEPKKRSWRSFFMRTRTPWREYKDLKGGWPKGYDKKLLGSIKEYNNKWLNGRLQSRKVNIVMLGQVRSGKSATINTLFSICQGHISVRSKAESSFTRKFEAIEGIEELEKIVFYDIMGLELAPDHVMTPRMITECVTGQVQVGTIFNEDELNTEKEQQVLKDIRITQGEMHCIVYCVDAELIFNEAIPGLLKKITSVEDALKIEGQERMVLVTKVDNICEDVKKDIREIYYSKNVCKAVENAAIIFDVPMNQVFPIKNYTYEMELDPYKNIPVLLALQKAVHFGIDFLLSRKSPPSEKQKPEI